MKRGNKQSQALDFYFDKNEHAKSLSLKFILIFAISVLVAGCQTPPLDIHAFKEPSADFSQYKTIQVSTMNRPSHRVIAYMNQAIESDLKAKGYTASSEQITDPDLIVTYQVTLNRTQQLKIEEIPAKGQVFTRPILEAVNKASILINAYDPHTHHVVWKASTTRDIRNVDATKIDQQRVNQRVDELFASFPAR